MSLAPACPPVPHTGLQMLQQGTASLLVSAKTAVLLEDIKFLMHFLQTLISQTLLAQDAGGLLKHAIN